MPTLSPCVAGPVGQGGEDEGAGGVGAAGRFCVADRFCGAGGTGDAGGVGGSSSVTGGGLSSECGAVRAFTAERCSCREHSDESTLGTLPLTRSTERGVEVSRCGGVEVWSRAPLAEPARHRLYRAMAREAFVLDDHDEPVPIELR
jgi:hypothetical protein